MPQITINISDALLVELSNSIDAYNDDESHSYTAAFTVDAALGEKVVKAEISKFILGLESSQLQQQERQIRINRMAELEAL